MKAIIGKNIALVALLVFATVLVSEHAEPQAEAGCLEALGLCVLALGGAQWVCANQPQNCQLANALAAAICGWAVDVCLNPPPNG